MTTYVVTCMVFLMGGALCMKESGVGEIASLGPCDGHECEGCWTSLVGENKPRVRGGSLEVVDCVVQCVDCWTSLSWSRSRLGGSNFVCVGSGRQNVGWLASVMGAPLCVKGSWMGSNNLGSVDDKTATMVSLNYCHSHVSNKLWCSDCKCLQNQLQFFQVQIRCVYASWFKSGCVCA